MVVLLCASASWAQSTGGTLELCHDSTAQDRQPDFKNDASLQSSAVSVVTDNGKPVLRLNTNLEVLNPERIYFPFTQQVRVSYLYESAGNSAALGYLYYKDLVTRGYIDDNGTPADTTDDKLKDSDGNGIADFHEELYKMSTSPTLGVVSKANRRCNRTFTYPYGTKTYTFYQPELGLNAGCDDTSRTESQPDASAPPSWAKRNVVVVGNNGGRSSYSSTEFGDNGLYPTIPNLLEPSDPKNSLLGIGHFVFLHADDDTDTGTTGNLAPVADSSALFDGIPDYNVSAFDQEGRPLSSAPAYSPSDEKNRTVDLGKIEGDQEVVFFLVSWGSAGHGPGYSVYPCLGFTSSTSKVCGLLFNTSTQVFFSKTFLNMDQNPVAASSVTGSDGKKFNAVATRDIGCPYEGGTSTGCIADGWLDAATLLRLKTVPAYNNLDMPHEKAYVKADTSARNLMPHVLVGAPSTDKYRWILGFEDLPGGGDRDFNDVSFMIHKSNGGVVRSAVVSGDLSPSISQDFTITEVTFQAVDDSYFSSTDSAFCRALKAEEKPRITYQVALDCNICKTKPCLATNPFPDVNPSPNWVSLALGDPAANGQRDSSVTINDFLQRSLTGSQLCWRAVMESKYDQCQPTIKNVNVYYKAMKAGDYSRASVSAVANAVVYGTFELPGSKWFDGSMTQPSTRVVDAQPDVVNRGHLYMKQLYAPENPTTATGTKLWDSGSKLTGDLASKVEDPLTWRKLYTLNPSNARAELKDLLKDADGGEAFSPNTAVECTTAKLSVCNCKTVDAARWYCDLNGSGGAPDSKDRALLRNWLYGWERRTGTADDSKRTWPMGGVQLSTPAIVGPALTPTWWPRVKPEEQGKFRDNFLSDARVNSRATIAYVGTTQGYLHAVDAGAWKTGDDVCTTTVREAHGYFAPASCASSTRNYGSSAERFAYLPRKMLPYYVDSYRRLGTGTPPLVDASPTVAEVDLGTSSYDALKGFTGVQTWTIGTAPKPLEGAKTVVVSATGPKRSVVFSLDITDPTSASYPQPMWEFDMSDFTVELSPSVTMDLDDLFHRSATAGGNAELAPDSLGSRHSPPVVRMDFGAAGNQKWVAVVGTDYQPNPATAGTLYLLDMKTGKPVQVQGGTDSAKIAGVVPLVKDEGVASGPVAVDINEDGTYDLLYVSTTKGKIFRISTNQVSATRGIGRALQVCQIADVQDRLTKTPAYQSEALYQGVYSNLALRMQQGGSGKTVLLYVGTGNNPDDANEAADKLSPRPHGYVLSFEDKNPTASDCSTPASHLWTQQLGVGQVVWGGMALSGENVTTATAVGKAATACELSGTDSGRFYNYAARTGSAQEGSGTAINGHSLSSPVMYDKHLIVGTVDGKLKSFGGGGYNNEAKATHPGPVRVHAWDANPSGIIQP